MDIRRAYARVLCLRAAAKRLQVPERTLRYQASHGRIRGAFKQGKLWKFLFPAADDGEPRVTSGCRDSGGRLRDPSREFRG